jgi:hypothetical protein
VLNSSSSSKITVGPIRPAIHRLADHPRVLIPMRLLSPVSAIDLLIASGFRSQTNALKSIDDGQAVDVEQAVTIPQIHRRDSQCHSAVMLPTEHPATQQLSTLGMLPMHRVLSRVTTTAKGRPHGQPDALYEPLSKPPSKPPLLPRALEPLPPGDTPILDDGAGVFTPHTRSLFTPTLPFPLPSVASTPVVSSPLEEPELESTSTWLPPEKPGVLPTQQIVRGSRTPRVNLRRVREGTSLASLGERSTVPRVRL